MAAQENIKAASAARNLQLLLLGRRRQLLGDPDQSARRLQLTVRTGRPCGQGPPRPQLQAAGPGYLVRFQNTAFLAKAGSTWPPWEPPKDGSRLSPAPLHNS